MNSKLENLVKECLKNGIPCVGARLDENNNIFFVFGGFSKSGTAELHVEKNEDGEYKLYSLTRYDTKDEIETFEDFAEVAFYWNLNYSDSFGWDCVWIPIFENFGWIERKIKEVEEIVVK